MRSEPGIRALIAVAICAVGCLGVFAAPAIAKKKPPVVTVHPGKADAIQKAVDAARAGTTIKLTKGVYPENVVIAKRLNLVSAGKGMPIIDGGCSTRFTVSVRHAGVVLRNLKVIGAADDQGGPYPSEVDFTDVADGTAEGLILRDSCDAEYGINVLRSAGIRLIGNEARGGFSDAGFYIGSITGDSPGAPGPLRVKQNLSYGNTRGIIIEESVNVDIRVSGNIVHNNDVGIFNHVSDGMLFYGNQIHDNTFGMYFIPDADDNRVINNAFSDNGTDFLDDGSGNCGTGNTPGGVAAAC